jgi:hypothetical protein
MEIQPIFFPGGLKKFLQTGRLGQEGNIPNAVQAGGKDTEGGEKDGEEKAFPGGCGRRRRLDQAGAF